MRIRFLGAVVGTAVGAAASMAQPLPPAPIPPAELPPLNLAAPPANVPPPLPGVVVSQALQAPPPLPSQAAGAPAAGAPSSALLQTPPPAGPSFYGSAEYLIWFPKGQPLPIIAARNDLNFDATLDNPGTRVILDSTNVRTTNVPGGRFTLGGTLTGRLGVEANYLFLATQRKFYSTADEPTGPLSSLGIPFIDANSGNESVNTLRSPTGGFVIQNGDVQVSTSTRVSGWEALATLPLFDVTNFRMIGLAGYRYFRLNEGLVIESASTQQFRFFGRPTNFNLFDEVTAANAFHGATVGTRSRLDLRRVYVELDSKISLGGVREVVTRAGGGTFAPVGGTPVALVNGNFVTPTNAGRFTQVQTAVLPETGLRLGFDLGPAQFFFGYNVIYLSEAARPGDQLDRTIDFGNGTTRIASPTGRPAPGVVNGDFWIQGVSFGLQGKY